MLLVILGAGASYDSLPQDILDSIPESDSLNFRPPLAKELFEPRPAFGEILDKYPQCADLVGRLRRRIREGADIERELETILEMAETYPLYHRSLTALRFYLQETLWTCGTRWRELSHGITNYGRFFRRVDEWRHANEEQVCVVNFNYDLLADDALAHSLYVDLATVEGFIADSRYVYLKLHGSANWGRRVRAPGDTVYSKADRARRVLIQEAPNLVVTDDFVLRGPDRLPVDTAPYASILLPAIAIPVATKFVFECPESHLEALDDSIGKTMRILIVGWRGSEQHFLKRFNQLPGLAPRVQIVGGGDEGVGETMKSLCSVGLDESVMRTSTAGFSGYLETDELEDFLTSW